MDILGEKLGLNIPIKETPTLFIVPATVQTGLSTLTEVRSTSSPRGHTEKASARALGRRKRNLDRSKIEGYSSDPHTEKVHTLTENSVSRQEHRKLIKAKNKLNKVKKGP